MRRRLYHVSLSAAYHLRTNSKPANMPESDSTTSDNDWDNDRTNDRDQANEDFPLPLLITGLAGVAGYNAFHHFRKLYGDLVIGQRPFKNWPLRGPGIEACDLEDRQCLAAMFRKYRFRSVLSCGGSCALKSCELDPAMAERVNVTGLQTLIDVARDYPNRLVHLSIDLVFSGTGDGDHVETDPVDPVTVYGRTMVNGEQLMLTQRPDVPILRISLPMGVSFNGHAGAIDWIQSRFAKHKPATLYFDEIRTPTYVECLNEVITRMMKNRLSGIYHCGGPQKMSLYQIAQVVNRIGGYNPELLQGCPRIQAGPMPPRAGNVTMDSQKLLNALPGLKIDRWPLDPRHVPTHRQWHYQREGCEVGSPEKLERVLYTKPCIEMS